MTEKSAFSEGKYTGIPIGKLLELGHTGYLRWAYYSLSGISFDEDILRKLHIITDSYDYRIEKPGTDEDMLEKLSGEARDRRIGFYGLKRVERMENVSFKIQAKAGFIRNRMDAKKGTLQAINHGRY